MFPGVALAQRAQERFPGCRVVFFRTQRPIEERVFDGLPFESERLEISAPGRRVDGWFRYWRQVRATVRIARPRLQTDFDVAFGLGGYASLPGVLAARRAGVPVVLLEQNAVAGRANRWLAPLADAVSCAYPTTGLRFGKRVAVTGNPVRREVLEARKRRATAPGRSGGRSDGARTVLVCGGSQGAHAINRAVCAALPKLLDFRERIRFIHLPGSADKQLVMDAYRNGSWSAEVLDFSSRLPDLLADSDLVVARGGGTTIAELAVLGVPAVVVPYPHHRDRHQIENAARSARAGAAYLVAEEELSATKLRQVFDDVLFSPGRLQAMEEGALALARPGAADAVLDLAVELKLERCRSHFASF